MSELLLQSAGDVIRVFPAWPAGTDGRFSRLLAQGGFEVSAERVSNVVQNLTIKSTVGGPVTIVNPWPGSSREVIVKSTGAIVTSTRTEFGETFQTSAGETYQLSQGN